MVLPLHPYYELINAIELMTGFLTEVELHQ